MFLKVDSAYPEDQGAGRARLDPDTMLQLRLSPGNLVYIEGKRRTVAKVWRMLVNDWNQGKIRIDSYIRLNAGASIGDRIEVTKVPEPIPAERVVLAPPEDLSRQVPINYNQAVNRLIDFPIQKNDTIPIQAGLPFMQPQTIAFKAIAVEPEDAVIITRDTHIEFSEKPAAGFEGIRQVSYEDIGGLKDELQRVRETIELPMRHPELFQKLGIEPPKGVLLFGPPGTGKTLIAKAVANESGAHFIPIAGPEVISKYYGESEQRLREIFEEAQDNAPSIIFIDELDSIAPRREDVTGEVERRVVAQLLTMMDGLEERGQVLVIGATNRVDAIDPALRRPGRFDREIEIGVPNEIDRLEILRIHTRGMPLEGEAELRMKKNAIEELENDLEKGVKSLENELQTLEKQKNDLSTCIAYYEKSRKKIDDYEKRIKSLSTSDDLSSAKVRKEFTDEKIHFLEEEETLRNKYTEYQENIVKLEYEIGELKSLIKNGEPRISISRTKIEDISQFIEIKKREYEDLSVRVFNERNAFLNDFAQKTNGFVGADLAALAREAAMRALRRYLPDLDLDQEEIPPEIMDTMEVKFTDFRDALREVSPSAMREVLLEVSHTTWNDVGGLDTEREEIREAVEYPLTLRERFDSLGINPPRGVLLYGPPGTGKTLIARAVAHESRANFIPVRGPQLLSKWVGESERAVREIFKKARQVAPSIIFFDELDAIAPSRGNSADAHVIESVVNQILTEMDGLADMQGVVVMGATNRPDIIDPALLRAGRFDRLVYIGEPDTKGRTTILDIHTRLIPLAGTERELLVEWTDGLDENTLEDIVEVLGTDRTVAPDEVRSAIPARESPGEPLNPTARRRILNTLMCERGLVLDEPVRKGFLERLAGRTAGYVGSDLELLCREAAMFALREGVAQVEERHFEASLAKVRPMMNERLRQQYQRIQQYFKGGLPVQAQPPEYQ